MRTLCIGIGKGKYHRIPLYDLGANKLVVSGHLNECGHEHGTDLHVQCDREWGVDEVETLALAIVSVTLGLP
ncbi:MAG: hypothetical protein MN733_03380 [Nitrososphaera sp.]|nr:hypothetical protein [Nitrososphaera sp.]